MGPATLLSSVRRAATGREAAERKRSEAVADFRGTPKHVKHASQIVDGFRGLLRAKREAMMAMSPATRSSDEKLPNARR